MSTAIIQLYTTGHRIVNTHALLVRVRNYLLVSGRYMYIRDNGVSIGHFGHFGYDLQTCFDVLAVRSEVQTQG